MKKKNTSFPPATYIYNNNNGWWEGRKNIRGPTIYFFAHPTFPPSFRSLAMLAHTNPTSRHSTPHLSQPRGKIRPSTAFAAASSEPGEDCAPSSSSCKDMGNSTSNGGDGGSPPGIFFTTYCCSLTPHSTAAPSKLTHYGAELQVGPGSSAHSVVVCRRHAKTFTHSSLVYSYSFFLMARHCLLLAERRTAFAHAPAPVLSTPIGEKEEALFAFMHACAGQPTPA